MPPTATGNTSKRKGGPDKPTFDKFYEIVKELAPQGCKFTKSGVVALRTVYFSYLEQVASGLVEHDKITVKDRPVVELACTLNGEKEFEAFLEAAKSMTGGVEELSMASKKRSKRQKITSEMEAEQERLLNLSKETMVAAASKQKH